jgi:hypothetical protein
MDDWAIDKKHAWSRDVESYDAGYGSIKNIGKNGCDEPVQRKTPLIKIVKDAVFRNGTSVRYRVIALKSIFVEAPDGVANWGGLNRCRRYYFFQKLTGTLGTR